MDSKYDRGRAGSSPSPLKVRAEVAPFGVLVHPYVEQSSFSPHLDAGAVEALRHCTMHGQAVGSTVRVVVLYELMNGDEYLPRGLVTVLPAPPAPPAR